MRRYYLLAFIASLICIFCHPASLSATDSFALRGLNDARAVQTVIPEPIVVPVVTPKAPVAGVRYAAATVAPAVNNSYSISVAGRTIPIYDVNSTELDAGNHVNHVGMLYYGHNSASVFGGLSGLAKNSVFSINRGGVVTSYKVTEIVTFDKNFETGTLQLGGKGSYMRGIKNTAWDHSLALMTCAGTPVGHNDATKRLVIFADAI